MPGRVGANSRRKFGVVAQLEWADKIDEAVRLANGPLYRALLLRTSSYRKQERKQLAKA